MHDTSFHPAQRLSDLPASPAADGADNPAPAYEFCRIVTRTHAKSFYFCAQTLPRVKRNPIYAIYALCREADDLADTLSADDPQRRAAGLAEWSQALRDLYARKPVPCHPVLIAWRDMLRTYPIRIEHPLELIHGVGMDLTQSRFATFQELYAYAYRVASLVGLMTSEVFGYSDAAALQYAVALGVAFQLTNILRDVGEDARRDRIYIPLEDLSRFRCSEADVIEGRLTPNMISLLKFQVARARDYYREADKGIPFLSPDSRFTVFLSSRLYAGILADIEAHGYDVFSRRARVSLPRKLAQTPKLWLQAKMSF
jgi:phytoene synthase